MGNGNEPEAESWRKLSSSCVVWEESSTYEVNQVLVLVRELRWGVWQLEVVAI